MHRCAVFVYVPVCSYGVSLRHQLAAWQTRYSILVKAKTFLFSVAPVFSSYSLLGLTLTIELV